jgi:hypothetical protein
VSQTTVLKVKSITESRGGKLTFERTWDCSEIYFYYNDSLLNIHTYLHTLLEDTLVKITTKWVPENNDIYSLTVLGAISSKSRCQQSSTPSGESFITFWQFWHNIPWLPWLSTESLQSIFCLAPVHQCVLFMVFLMKTVVIIFRVYKDNLWWLPLYYISNDCFF